MGVPLIQTVYDHPYGKGQVIGCIHWQDGCDVFGTFLDGLKGWLLWKPEGLSWRNKSLTLLFASQRCWELESECV